jgi:hypothetical protein
MDARAIKPAVDERTNTKDKGDKVKMTSRLIRWSGLAAMVAGAIFAGIQPFHPADVLASVTTNTWTLVMTLKLVMCFLFVAGITGLYVRQADKLGRLGIVGFLLLGLSWGLQAGFVFVELFVLPVLATTAPQFVESFLGIVNGVPGEMNIGALPAVYGVTGVLYILGGLVFGIKTFHARVLPRWPAGLLVVAAAITPFATALPHALQRYAAVPMGIALIWLGLALFSERQEQAS